MFTKYLRFIFVCKILIVVLFLNSACFAQSIDTAKLDSFFNILSKRQKAMGSFAVAKNGKIIYQKTIGYSYINDTTKITADRNTHYDIGSISKMFTATMIFQLIDEGKLSLQTTLDKYYPQVPYAKQITIEYLLRHRSGLYDVINRNTDTAWIHHPHTGAEVLKKIISGKPEFEPGTKYMYSNSGYILLADIIESITRKSFSDDLERRICNKIKLKSTYFASVDKLADNEAGAYFFVDKWPH